MCQLIAELAKGARILSLRLWDKTLEGRGSSMGGIQYRADDLDRYGYWSQSGHLEVGRNWLDVKGRGCR